MTEGRAREAAAGSTDRFGETLTDRTVRTLTYAVRDEVKAVAAIFPL
jgi:acyl-ACP thioesterase